MIPACWHLCVPKPPGQEQVYQKEAKDFSLALLLLPGAWATTFSSTTRKEETRRKQGGGRRNKKGETFYIPFLGNGVGQLENSCSQFAAGYVTGYNRELV